jgi:Flp pilus assembly protein TadG
MWLWSSEHHSCARTENKLLPIRHLIALLAKDTDGSSMIELAIILPAFMLLFVTAVDFGGAYFIAIEVSAAAQAGALYGVQNPTDLSGMRKASVGDAASLPNLTATATYGCECSDGSSVVASCTTPPTCAYNYVSYVDVTTSVPYTLILSYPGMPSPMNIRAEARMRIGGD